MCRTIVWLALFVVAWLSNSAQAQMAVSAHSAQALRQCGQSTFYTAQSPGSIPRIVETLTGDDHKLVFRVCTDMERNQHIFLREPRANRNGVCRSFEREVFAGDGADSILIELLYDGQAPNWYVSKRGWTVWPPAQWTARHYTAQKNVLAFVSNASCPAGDDAHYLPVENITDGTLKAFYTLWSAVSTEPKAFDRNFAMIAVKGLKPVNETERQQTIAAFRQAVFAGEAKPWSISCAENGDGCSALIGNFAFHFDTGARGIEPQTLSVLLAI